MIFKSVGVALSSLLLTAAPAAARLPQTGDVAPDFQLRLVDGNKVSLAELKGQVVILNFWATWCVPCRKELPLLDAYYNAQKSHGLRVFAVTTEDSLQPYQLKKLFAVMHMTPALRMQGPYASVSEVPTNYVIDRAGKIRYAKAAAFTLDDLNKILVPLLQEPAPTG